jgi:glycosyltransferase involved in cell wall biosynthesis
MRKEKEVSIVIAAHKDRGYIEECYQSCLRAGDYFHAQTGKSYEIVFAIDDAYDSEFVSKLVEHYRHTIFVTGQRIGLAGNMNNALRWIAGKYFKVVADDDLLTESSIYDLFKAFDENTAAVTAELYTTDDTGAIITGQSTTPDWSIKELINGRKLCAGCAMVKREAYEDVEGFDESFSIAEFYILWRKFYQRQYNIRVLHKPVMYYRRHDNQKSLGLTLEQKQARQIEVNAINERYLI